MTVTLVCALYLPKTGGFGTKKLVYPRHFFYWSARGKPGR